MKKTLVAAVVGGLIIFLWQFLSFALVNFHKPAQAYTDKQDAIMNFLNTQQLKEGGYILPSLPEGATMQDHEQLLKTAEGKPWASIQYHNSLQNNMAMNMVRGLVVNIVMVFLFCWLVKRMNAPSTSTILLSALVVGLIVFMNVPYTSAIWYQSFDTWAYLLDAVAGWGLTGLWLAWWLRRGKHKLSAVKKNEPAMEMAD